jgi:hypothetical protein
MEIRKVDVCAPCEYLACIVAIQGPVGAHVAIWYTGKEPSSHFLLHQAWHYDTRNDPPADFLLNVKGKPVVVVVPTFNLDEAKLIRARCALVATRIADNSLPYAFLSTGATFLADGTPELGSSRGLTCATFVLKLLESVEVSLVAAVSWQTVSDPNRLAHDKDMHTKIVDYLHKQAAATVDKRDREALQEHARAVATEIDTPRIRAEEVAAASGLMPRPGDFATVEPEGRRVLEAVQPPLGGNTT